MTASCGDQGKKLRHLLRSETAEQHQALHRHPSFHALAEGQLDRRGYTDLMERLLSFYQGLDPAIRALDPPYDYAPRAPILATDLAVLAPGRKLQSAPLGRLVTPRSLAGVLYVVEGALLGGGPLDRAARQVLGGSDPAGRRYWAWCRAEGKHRFPQMLAFVEAQQAHGLSDADLVAGARATFAAFAKWFAPLAPAGLRV